jgi:serine/threonine protein kinase
MGEVYRARDTRLGRYVAIKSLPAAFAQDPERVARFKREAQLLAALNRPVHARRPGLKLRRRDDDHSAAVYSPVNQFKDQCGSMQCSEAI